MTLNEREKELELFNAFVKKELPELFEKHSNGNFFAKVTYDSMFGAWLGAKAQAVPEGHVVVNKNDLEIILDCVTPDDINLVDGVLEALNSIKDVLKESGAEG